MLTEPTTRKKRLVSGLLQDWLQNLDQEFVFADPANVRQENLLRQIESAESHGKLFVGIHQVWRAAEKKRDADW